MRIIPLSLDFGRISTRAPNRRLSPSSSEIRCDVFGRRRLSAGRLGNGGRRRGVRFTHQGFDLSNRKALFLDSLGECHLFGGIGDRQNRTGVAEGDFRLTDELLNRFGKFEKSNEVGHRRTIDADLAGEFVVSHGESADVLLKRLGFFDGVEIAALQVFDEREDEHLLIVEFDDPHRNV